MDIGIDTSIPCGLIINELLSNALKHAFPEKRKGEIDIKIYRTDDGEIEMIFRDNGIGLPESYDFRNSPGFGFRMIIDLVEYKLMGRINLIRGESSPPAGRAGGGKSSAPFVRGEGTQFQIIFKEIKYKKRI
jgi:two-component sensor histidine kinase